MIGRTLWERRWERRLHQRGRASALAVAGDHIVVHERYTRLVCLDRRDGSVRWDIATGKWPRGVVIAGDRCLVLPQNTDRLSCIDLATGSVVWCAALDSLSGHVVATTDTVLVGGWRGYRPLAAFDLRDGRALWRTDAPAHTVRPLPWAGAVLLGSGQDARLIDPRDGGELAHWRLPEPLADADHRPVFTAIGPDHCLARCGPRSLVVLRRSSGAVDRFATHDSDLSPTAAEFTGGAVWLRDRRAGSHAVDPADGSKLWTVDVGQPLVEGVARAGEGFAVASGDGLLYRLGADGRVVGRSSQARRIDGLRDLGAGEVLLVTKGTLTAVGVAV
ncbi:hypothetical protein FCH28_36550 [Streptomyces piniterrae]|uniref:Pyrrolo-quinoline quinone repeat domain-containing protein n=1 Tax=Streptomyces piniterrae TaxID=2571125 RepID=A0A4U0MLM9_9ACTN|nr:PQQ-binding-like beta-propeller repeat protein [Streptomyces piniterrae]TJZ41610.1 hypothetical protein FCH28_36550 [Streptomyces piniterrae]